MAGKELLRDAVRTWRGFPWWMWGCALVWGGLLVAWLPAVYRLVPSGSTALPGTAREVLAWLIGAALLWTIVWGALLGYRRAWPVLLVSAPAGTALLMACYVAAMLASAPASTRGGASGDDDNAAGAGLVILGLPTLLAVASLLGVGAGIGWSISQCRKHLRTAATATSSSASCVARVRRTRCRSAGPGWPGR